MVLFIRISPWEAGRAGLRLCTSEIGPRVAKALDQSTQKVRLGKQILIDFRALPLINEFNTLGRTPGYVANSCWADS